MRFATVGRWIFALLAALVLSASGCASSSTNDAPNNGGKSVVCAPDACERGTECGCVGMDPGCNCDLCQQSGECHLINGKCFPASVDDCRRPNGACENYGECQLGSIDNRPICMPGGDDDCRASELCVIFGACSQLPELPYQCDVRDSHDCAGSAVCKELGCCTAIDSECSRSDGTCPDKCCGDELC